jgi:hypothetical protein
MSVQNILNPVNGKIDQQFLDGGNVYGFVQNPMTADLECSTYHFNNAGRVNTSELNTTNIGILPGSLQPFIEVKDTLRFISGKKVEFIGDATIETNNTVSLKGSAFKMDSVPLGVATSVLGYDTATDTITYFPTPGSGGGVSGVVAGANITVDNTNPAVPIVSLSSPLTSAIDVGTQDITTTTVNADIDFTTNGTGAVHITKNVAGTALRVLNTLQGTVGVVSATPASIELYKNRGTAPAVPPVAGDSLGQISAFGKDTANTKHEYTRITASIRDPTAGGTRDGSLEFACATNNAITTYIQLNGNDAPAGEVNILKPLDLGQGSTGLIKTSVLNGNINITSDGLGYTALNSASGQVQLNGGNSVVAKGVNGVLLQTGLGVDKLKVLPTAVELAGVPLDAMGQRVKSSSGSFLVGDGSISVDTRISGLGVSLTAGTNDTAYRFMDCFGLTGDVYIYRRTNFARDTGIGQPAVFEVVIAPFPSLQMSGLPIAPSAGISDGSTTGSAGQVITAIGGGNWAWTTPSNPPADSLSAVLNAGNNAGSTGIDMNGNNITTSGGDFAIDASLSSGGGNISAIIKTGGNLIFSNLPASNPGVAGALWNNGGVLNIA